MTEQIAQRHENNFDFLRLFAASAVVVGHSFWLSGNLELEPLLAFTGHSDMADIAVNLFFVMSGFLIAASWQNSRGVIDFAGKRALRIFPALFVSVIFCALLVGSLATTRPIADYLVDGQTLGFFTNALLLTKFHLPGVFADNHFPDTVNGSLWTLPYEVAMYATVLLLGTLKLFDRRLVLLMLLPLALAQFLAPQWGVESIILHKLSRLGLFFFFGSALYLYRNEIAWNWKIATGLLALTVFSAGSKLWFFFHVLTLPYLAIYLAHVRAPLLANCGKAGDFSYGVYIFSFPVQQLIMHWNPQLPLGTFIAVSLAISLVLAALSWHFIEAPALALKRFLPGKARRARLPLVVNQ